MRLVDRQERDQLARQPGSADLAAGVSRDDPAAREEAKAAPHRGQLPRDRRSIEPERVEPREIRADRARVDGGEGAVVLARASDLAAFASDHTAAMAVAAAVALCSVTLIATAGLIADR